MADFVGSRVDRYEVQARVGTGGMARVYRAHDTNLDRTVAIKILHEHLADDPNFKERFEREAKLVASLSHPNIVQVYDFNVVWRDEFPQYYMVMPFLPGKTLRDVLAEGAAKGELPSYDRVLEVMLSLTEALGYAHAAGMVHRDVKPANIMLTDKGKVILTDFGIARMVVSSRLTQDGVSTGTPAYMSPEQASGLPGDTRSDIYALGIILFELLTSKTPYGDEGGISVILKHLNDPIPNVSTYMPTKNEELDALVTKALAKKADHRYQTVEEFAEAIIAAFLGKLVQELPKSLSGTSSGFSTAPRPISSMLSTVEAAAVAKTLVTAPQRVAQLGLLTVGLLLLVAAVGLVALRTPPPSTVGAIQPDRPETTDAPSMTSNTYFASSFDGDDSTRSNWPLGDLGTFVQEITPDGFYHLRNQRVSTAATAIFNPDYSYTSVAISMEGTIDEDSNPAGAFGIVFRYQDQEHYNVFAVDGMGRFSIWIRNEGAWTELRHADDNWTRNPAINRRGEKNLLLLDAVGSMLTGYANGEQVFRVLNNTFQSGNIGIYVATHTDGVTDVKIDSYGTYLAAPPSMTGG
jgi:serine/threonine protein kinase